MEVPTPPIRKTSTCLTLLLRLPRPDHVLPPRRTRPGGGRAAPGAGPCGAGLPGRRGRPVVSPVRCRIARDTVTRRLAHEPFGWRPTTLLVTVRRYRCSGCGHVWRQDTDGLPSRERGCRAARCGGRWKGSCPAPDRRPDRRGLGVSWDTANEAVLAEGRRVLIDDPNRFDGVQVIGVDEHVGGTPAAATSTSR